MISLSKLKYEEIKKTIEEANWTLISETYKNLNTDLQLLCPLGHEVYMTYADWRNKAECLICKKSPIVKINEKPKKKKGYRILALDQSTNTTGWSLFEDGKLLNYGQWTSTGNETIQKISCVKTWLSTMVDKHHPDKIVLEDIQLQSYITSNNNSGDMVLTYKKLAALQGVLCNFLYENGISYTIVPPATWREHSNIKGKTRNDKKKSAQIRVKNIYEIEVNVDVAEAILIGEWATEKVKTVEKVSFY